MNVETKRRPWRRRWRFWRRPPDLDAAAYLRCLERVAGAYAPRITWRRVPATGSVQETILAEAAKGYHFVMLGASGYGHPVHDPFLAELVQNSPTHLVIVAKGGSVADAALPFKRVLVPTNGSHVADAALEFAVRYAQTVQARVSVLYVAESHKNSPIMPAVPLLPASRHMQDLMRETLRRQYGERISPPALAEFRVRESESLLAGLLDEVAREGHDLVVLGAESRSLVDRLYLGTQIEAAIEELPCTLALVIPKALGRK
jgi:nucleotide-binding universal stress UspA family protein